MSTIDLTLLIPKVMQNDFWSQFLDACSDEMELLKSDIATPIIDIYNARELTTIPQLQEITKTFGFYPDTSLNGSVDFYKSEIDSIAYRIKRKTTYPGYDYIFKSIPIVGYVYNIFWDEVSMVKAWDETAIETALAAHDLSVPFTLLYPEYYYSFFENDPFLLDDGYTLDDNFYLDRASTISLTHHLAIEIVPVSLMFTVDSSEPYLMTNTYLDYVKYYTDYTRKATEAPHVGVQISLITDTSRYYNNLNGGLEYTVPDLRANFAVTQNFTSFIQDQTFKYLVAGTGLAKMYGVGETLGPIDDLDEELFEKELSENESSDEGDYYKINSYVPTGTVKNNVLFVGDGSTFTRSGYTKYKNIIPKSFVLTYFANNQLQTISDATGAGVLDSDIFSGTINYSTGQYDINFVNSVEEDDTLSPGGVSAITTNLSYNTVILDSVEVQYEYSGSVHIARSNSLGVISEVGGFIGPGSVVDTLGNITVNFLVTVDMEPIICTYDFYNYGIPRNGYPVKLSYRTTDVVRIREIGIKDYQGRLVAYATVPPTYVSDRDFHLSVNLFIKK